MNISHLWKAPAGEWLQENWTQFAISFEKLPSGKLLHNYGQPASLIILIGKSTIHGPFHQRVDSTWFSDNRRRPCGSCQSKPAAAPKESASVPRLGSRGKNHGGFPNGKKTVRKCWEKIQVRDMHILETTRIIGPLNTHFFTINSNYPVSDSEWLQWLKNRWKNAHAQQSRALFLASHSWA